MAVLRKIHLHNLVIYTSNGADKTKRHDEAGLPPHRLGGTPWKPSKHKEERINLIHMWKQDTIRTDTFADLVETNRCASGCHRCLLKGRYTSFLLTRCLPPLIDRNMIIRTCRFETGAASRIRQNSDGSSSARRPVSKTNQLSWEGRGKGHMTARASYPTSSRDL